MLLSVTTWIIQVTPTDSLHLPLPSGLQNAFLVTTKHSLATVYNDRSVLENRHVSCLYTLVAEHPEADVFQYLDDGSWRDVRKIIIESILHTDMVQHFGMVSKVEIFYELHASEINSENSQALFENADDRFFLFAMLLHCADISNPVRPLNIAEKCDLFSENEICALGGQTTY